MLITTLGTSHGNHTSCRYNTATLIETGERSYLVDVGEPVVATMIRLGKDLDALKAVFITHMHGDHSGGLPMLIKMLRKYPKEGKQTEVFFPDDVADALGEWLRAMVIQWPIEMIPTHVVRPGAIYDDGVLEVSAEPTRHLRDAGRPEVPLSFAYVLEAEGKRVVCTGDLRSDFSDFPQTARTVPCDACVCEITHFQPEVALPVLMECPIKQLILTHVHDPWHGEDGERLLKEKLADLPYPWHIAHDCDEFGV
jgi:ribonuclease BN (tRNA processing enzyme)